MKHIVKIIGVLLLITAYLPLLAQGEDPAPVPIDGGASILIAAGVAYGVKRYRDIKK